MPIRSFKRVPGKRSHPYYLLKMTFSCMLPYCYLLKVALSCMLSYCYLLKVALSGMLSYCYLLKMAISCMLSFCYLLKMTLMYAVLLASTEDDTHVCCLIAIYWRWHSPAYRLTAINRNALFKCCLKLLSTEDDTLYYPVYCYLLKIALPWSCTLPYSYSLKIDNLIAIYWR